VEHDRYNETYLTVECMDGCVELGPDYWVRVTMEGGTHSERYPPAHYPWAAPEFAVVHASIVPCLRDLLRALRTGWTVGSLKHLCESNVYSVTCYETSGWRGVMEREDGPALPDMFRSLPRSVYPLYHVLADAGEYVGASVLPRE
jgi:hypothetical protein